MTVDNSRRTETFPGYNFEVVNAHSPVSDYSCTSESMFSATFYQTAPSADLFQGQSWDNTTVEGAQTYIEFPENGETEEFSTFYGHVDPKDSVQDYDVKAEATPSAGGEAMCRQASAASHKSRSVKTSSKARARGHSNLHTAQMASYNVPSNSTTQAFQDGSHAAMDMPISFPNPGSQMLCQAPISIGMPEMSTVGLMEPTQIPLDHSYDPILVASPESWDSNSSHGASPRTISDVNDDNWTVATSSPPGSHSSSPTIQGQPRVNHKFEGFPIMTTDDLQGSVMAVQDEFSLPPSYGSRRPSNEGETARDHPLYKNAFPDQADGLYHCPWEGSSGCTHKPEKLKCNYDKFVDSHLKPYRCKVESCENARFSSTACLLRHEREAHAMHGHGDKPYLCTYEGCDRAVPGNGFPRQWNLKDHMRRVHNDNGPSTRSPVSHSSGSSKASPTSKSSSKGRKRKQDPESGSTRKSTLKATSGSDNHGSRRSHASSLAAKQPLIDEWYENHVALQNMVSSMSKPDAMETLSTIKDAQDRLGRLTTLSQNLIYNQGNRR